MPTTSDTVGRDPATRGTEAGSGDQPSTHVLVAAPSVFEQNAADTCESNQPRPSSLRFGRRG